MSDQLTIGNTVNIKFISVGNKTAEGKVDTGATTSSLDASEIRVNDSTQTVSFKSPAISDNLVTMDLVGSQEVHSADGGGQVRPTIKFDIEINGMPVKGALFNLNDRSNMDAQVLIGQNVLQAGGFQIDVNKQNDDDVGSVQQVTRDRSINDTGVNENALSITQAIETLANNNVTLTEMIEYMRIIAINKIK